MASEIGIKIGLQGAEAVQGGLQRVVGSMGQLGGQVDTVRNALTTLAPTLAGALSVGGIAAFIRGTVNAIDAMNDLADATGASIEEISKLDQVARRNGATLDQVGGMLVKFNAQLKEADGKNGASIALEAIGLNAAKLRQLDPAEALRQTAVALAGFENDANKARITQELFGKSVREAAPFLNDLAEAGELNASVTKAQAAEAERFNKQMAQLSTNITSSARALVSDFLPALNDSISIMMRFSANGGVLSGFFTLLTSQFKDARIQATLEEISRLEGRLSNPNVTGFNRSTLQKELQDAVDKLRELQGESLKARTALDAALGRRNAGAGRGDDVNPPFAVPAPSVIDIAGEQAKRKAADDAAVQAAKARQTELDIQAKRQLANIVAYEKAEADLEEQLQRSLKAELDLASARGLKSVAAYEAAEQAIDDNLAKARQLVDAIDRETAVLQMSNVEREVSAALLELERAGLEKGSYAYDEYAAKIRESVISRESVRDSIEQTRKIEDEWRRTTDQIGQSLSDALMQGGKSAWEYIKGLFRSMVLRPVIQAIVNPIAGAFTSALGFSGAASAGTGAAGAGGGLGSLLSAGASLLNGGLGNMLGLNLVNSGLGQSLGLSTVQNIGGNMIAGPTGLGSMVGSGLGMLGNGFMGYGISKALSGGYSAGGAVNTIAGIASAIPGIGPIAGVVGGLVNRAFGMKAKEMRDTGIQGSLSGGAATGQSFQDWFQKGGWFRSNKSGTNFSALGDDTSAALNAGAMSVLDSTRAWAKALRLPGDELSSVSNQFRVKFTGNAAKDQAEIQEVYTNYAKDMANVNRNQFDELSSVSTQFRVKFTGDAAKDQAAIQEVYTRYAEDMANVYQNQLEPFRRAGESISDTLQRLAGLQTFSESINEFGGIFSRVANLSVDAREELLGFAGGMEAFVAKTQSFVQNYYDEAELAGITARQVRDDLRALGIEAEIFSRADFRRLVEAADVSNQDGRRRLSQLLTVAQMFAPVGRFLEANGGSLNTLADMAPATGAVQQILGGTSMEGLASLTDATTAGSNATVSTLERLIARVGELEDALVKALDKSGRAVADSVYFDNGNRSWDELALNGGGA
jgi:hypothetical protein